MRNGNQIEFFVERNENAARDEWHSGQPSSAGESQDPACALLGIGRMNFD